MDKSVHVWHTWQSMIDGRVHPEVTFRAGVFIWVGDELLLIRGVDIPRGKRRVVTGKWGPPKGCVEPGEKFVWETALRELHEETGIAISPELIRDGEISLYIRHHGTAIKSLYLFYTLRLVRKPRVRISRDEISKYGWFDHVPENSIISLKYYLASLR